MNLAQEFKIADAVIPQADWRAITSRAINVANAHMIYIVIHVDENSGTETYTPQRNDESDTGWIALANTVPLWVNTDTTANDTLVRQTNALAYTSNATAGEKLIIFEIDPRKLGLHTGAGTLQCTRLRFVAANDQLDVGSALFYVVPRYKQATPPEVRV